MIFFSKLVLQLTFYYMNVVNLIINKHLVTGALKMMEGKIFTMHIIIN